MFDRIFVATLIFFVTVPLVTAQAQNRRPAKELFGYTLGPAKMKSRPIGSYARGCLAGGEQLPKTGDAWQAMRLSRNRNWGHPVLVAFLKRLATTARARDGWPGLLVGDMSQPRGGPMLTGHASHQIGLDGDIWLTPMPANVQTRRQRENRSAVSMLARGGRAVDPQKWSLSRAKLIRRAALDRRVARIFVHPAIKKELCSVADKIGDNRNWLRRVRPWWGHHYHFHVRLKCPHGMGGCKNQPEPPVGDGCGKPLDYWFAKMFPKKPKKPVKPVKPRKKKKKKKKYKKRYLTLASLPVACRTVIASGDKRRMKRLRYGVVGDIPPPGRNPKRAPGSNLAWRIAASEVVEVVTKAPEGETGKADIAPAVPAKTPATAAVATEIEASGKASVRATMAKEPETHASGVAAKTKSANPVPAKAATLESATPKPVQAGPDAVEAARSATAAAEATTTGTAASAPALPKLVKAAKPASAPRKMIPFPNKAMPFVVKPDMARPQPVPAPPKPGESKSGKQSSGNTRTRQGKKLNLTAGAGSGVNGVTQGLASDR